MKRQKQRFLSVLLLALCLLCGCQQNKETGSSDISVTAPQPSAPEAGGTATPEAPSPSTQTPAPTQTPSGPVSPVPTEAVPTGISGATPSVTAPSGALTDTPAPTSASTPTPTKKPAKPTATPTPRPTYAPGTVLGKAPTLSQKDYFYNSSIAVSVTAEKKGTIYYTTDGSEPTTGSKKYTGPITISASGGSTPKATVLRVKAFYSDGSESPTAVHTYFVGSQISSRFTTLVFSVSGNPADLTKGPNGILYGKNYEKRGRESERAIYLEVFNKNGAPVISQYSGVRVYGGASRQSEVKSLKLFARKSYGSGIGKFKYNFFNNKNNSGSYIASYDKLVLRSYGNDWQFAYLRDEMCQRLAAKAGFPITESVVPAVVYLNGEYYNFVWLHESYCDDFLKQKFGGKGKKGEFIILEGGEMYKSANEDDETETKAAEEYHSTYWSLAQRDLTDANNYKKITDFLDVESYLDYYAFNIYINNWDWPNNNYKLYRYYPGKGESNGSGVFDGRWRFLLHDTDYSFGLYGQDLTQAEYDNLARILDPNDNRYSPLFDSLMKRKDCREYFVKKILELSSGALSYSSVNSMLNTMTGLQKKELSIYMNYLKSKYNCWTNEWSTRDSLEQIRTFAKARPNLMISMLSKHLGMTEEEIRALK